MEIATLPKGGVLSMKSSIELGQPKSQKSRLVSPVRLRKDAFDYAGCGYPIRFPLGNANTHVLNCSTLSEIAAKSSCKTHWHIHSFVQNAHCTEITVIKCTEEDIMLLVTTAIRLALDISRNRKPLRQLLPYRPIFARPLQWICKPVIGNCISRADCGGLHPRQ